jgi:ferredoxin
MAYKLEKRIEIDNDTLVTAMKVFETPTEFYDQARLMVTNEELVLIANMGTEICAVDQLKKIIADNDLADNPDGFIDSAWRRVVIDKVQDENTNEIKYAASSFYNRFSIFAQYEPAMYRTIPKSVIDAMNAWDFEVYLGYNRKTVLDKMKGVGLDVRIHQSDFMTLDEALRAIDECENNINIVPCNCKAMTYYHHKPTDVCINLGGHQDAINSQQSRGYGKNITKAEAKELISNCDKSGLMHVGEYEHYCNCDSICCYPLKMAKVLNSRGVYPRAHYKIDWHEDECNHCGECTRICNYSAFAYDAYKKVVFEPDKCYGCTICSTNCSENAIHLVRIESTPIPGSKEAAVAKKNS